MRTACDVSNAIPYDSNGKSRLELFSGVPVSPSLKDFHTYGCPVFVLDNALQACSRIPWNPRGRMRLYLGTSPKHARSVALVLNLTTGLVSPQFHIQFFSFLRQPGTTVQNHLRHLHGNN